MGLNAVSNYNVPFAKLAVGWLRWELAWI